MRSVLFCFIICCFCNIFLSAQDSLVFGKDFRLYEGIYLSYQDFRYNWPIPKEKIKTTISKDQLDFYTKTVEDDYINYVERDGSLTRVKTDDIWGYCQNNSIYVQHEHHFFRIPVFGAISYFVGTVEVINYSGIYEPFTTSPVSTTPVKTQEMRQYLLDFYSGEMALFSVDKLEFFLKRDEILYKEYMQLGRKKKRDLASRYIRLYNDKHPVYFPKD
jgi:hypothetical protein